MGNVGKFWRQLNYFVRGEAFLYIVTMFSIVAFLVKLFPNIHFSILLGITIITAFTWEFLGKRLENKTINKTDILMTLIGGVIGILLFKIL